ncbi:MAG: S9 family peptidase [Asticcacaulis sp.]
MKRVWQNGVLGAAIMMAMGGMAVADTAPKPPVAAKKPYDVKAPFGAVRQDEYYWLRDDKRENPEMLAHLKAENAYTDAMLAAQKPLRDGLYKEITGRLVPDDSSVPYFKNGYYYQTRFVAGKDYPLVVRRKGALSAPEEVLLDQNAMAEGKGYFAVSASEISPDNTLLAYAEDTVGRRQYTLKVKDLATGKIVDEAVSNIESNILWAADNKTIFYVEKDPVTLLSKRIKAHVLGTPASADRLVYEEADDSFYMGLEKTSDDKYICVVLQSTVSNEQRCAPSAAPMDFRIIAPRERDFLYQGDHVGDHWVIRTNFKALNYRLVTLKDADGLGDRAKWSDLAAHDPKVFIERFQPFDGFVAIEERANGNKRLRLLKNDGSSVPVAADDAAYTMALNVNAETGTDWVRYSYQSLIVPASVIEVNAKTLEKRVLKVQAVPGYDASQYVTERVWITARDGVKVPVSLAYKKGFKKDGKAALFQYAYGSYGASTDPSFRAGWVSMLDRGMVVAIAHIRGGQELGRVWYDDGHLLKKKNSFTDFIDVTRGLVAQKYAAPGRVAALGGSAGGLLMGGVLNMAPKDYGAVVAAVPFVDVVTTMLDASIPLTTNEYDEWGNPEQKPYYDYMLSYSPYDNIRAQAYPATYVSTGLWDSQVQYYEPAKWVARLRATKTDANPLLFRVNMEAGHGGKSGRYRAYEEQAEYLAFILRTLKVEQ